MLHRDESRASTSKQVRETEAEAVAFVVSHAIGPETGTAAKDYIQLYDGDAKLLTESLERIPPAGKKFKIAPPVLRALIYLLNGLKR